MSYLTKIPNEILEKILKALYPPELFTTPNWNINLIDQGDGSGPILYLDANGKSMLAKVKAWQEVMRADQTIINLTTAYPDLQPRTHILLEHFAEELGEKRKAEVLRLGWGEVREHHHDRRRDAGWDDEDISDAWNEGWINLGREIRAAGVPWKIVEEKRDGILGCLQNATKEWYSSWEYRRRH